MTRLLYRVLTVVLLASAATAATEPRQTPPVRSEYHTSALGEFTLQVAEKYNLQAQENLREAVEAVAVALVGRYGPVTPRQFDLIVVRNRRELFAQAGRELPDWIQAVALEHPPRVVMLMPTTRDLDISVSEFEQTLMHELTHMYLFRLVPGNPTRAFPSWFHEGLAIYTSNGFNRSLHWALVKARLFHRFFSLGELRRLYHSSADQSTQAYAQAYLAVRLMADSYGPDIFREIFAIQAGGGSFADAFGAASGESLAQFEEYYLDELGRRYNLLLVMANPRMLFITLPLLLLLAYFTRRWRNAGIKARWQLEEERRLESSAANQEQAADKRDIN